MSALGAAILGALDDDDLAALIDLAWPKIAERLPAPAEDGWLDSHAAARYLGVSRNALHKLSAARAIPCEQGGPGCKLWFRRCDLDAWRRGERKDASKMLPKARLSAVEPGSWAKKNPA